MAGTILTADELDFQIEEATSDLRGVILKPSSGNVLNLAGLAFFTFLGAKVVLPIACGFVSRVLYDKYKNLTKSGVEAARADLGAPSSGPYDPVELDVIRGDITASLVAEGIPQDKAVQVVERAIGRFQGRFAS